MAAKNSKGVEMIKVAEIQKMLDTLPEEAELSHVWTHEDKKAEIKEDMVAYKTTLYFKCEGVQSIVTLPHEKPIGANKNRGKNKKKEESSTLTQKMGSFFKGQSNAGESTSP